jgi:chromosome segregation protein
MYLEKLEIQGFKSFANKNKLIFSGMIDDQKRGITSVVGPNGSGKSNIADAIRWVLGEQSSKILRSKKNDDVIFIGSDKKARLNFAEVSLYLNNQDANFKSREVYSLKENDETDKEEVDNIDALLMLPEIVLSRRVYRDGHSEYLINGNKVRLSDVQIFLAKANFGQKTYSVIGQGMVENFLNTTPAERKSFFDEATGVKQHQIKRDISLNKLESSQENLGQVEMLLKEIEPRLNSLTRQLGRLKKRKSLEEELEEKQIKYFGFLWNDINDKLQTINVKIEELEKNKEEIKEVLDKKKEEANKINGEVSISEDFLNLQNKLSEIKEEMRRLEKQKSLISDWEYFRSQSKNKEEVDNLKEEKRKEEKDLSELRSDFSKIPSLDSKYNELREKESEFNKIEEGKREKSRELMKLDTFLELKLEKSGNFDISFLFSRETELKSFLKEKKEELGLLEIDIKNRTLKLDKEIEIERSLIDKIRELELELKRVHSEYNPSNIKKINIDLANILDVIKKTEESSDLSFFKKVVSDIKNNLNDLINFVSGQKFDNAIEKINLKIIDFKNKKEKTSSNLSSLRLEINIAKNKKNQLEENINKALRDLKEVQSKIESSKKEEDLEDVKNKKSVLEKELEIVNSSSFSLKKEIEEIRNSINNSKEERFSLERQIRQIQESINRKEVEINSLKSSDAKIQAKIENIEEEIINGLEGKKDNIDFVDLVKDEKIFIDKKKEDKKAVLEELESKVFNFNKKQEEKRQYSLNLQKEIHEREASLNSIYNSLNSFKIELAREETRMEELDNNILDEDIDIEAIKKCQENEINIDSLRGEINKIKNNLELIGGIDPEVENEYIETKKRYDFLFEQTTDLNKTIRSLERVIIELDTLIKERFDSEFKLISEKFNEYFKILFNGGNAKIFPIKEESLADSLNEENSQKEGILKKIKYLKKYNAIGLSGVDILAVPPGKKISSIGMLSGGERALTSIALICAIISANPAPFVVLDEVDAALDEANSERLAKILDDLSDKTQFIAITHNRATMKRANILYGVTMGDDGVSRLLSIKLDEYSK